MEIALILSAAANLLLGVALYAAHERLAVFAKDALTLTKAGNLEEKFRVESLDRTLKAAEYGQEDEIAPASFASELMKNGVAEDEHGDKWGLG